MIHIRIHKRITIRTGTLKGYTDSRNYMCQRPGSGFLLKRTVHVMSSKLRSIAPQITTGKLALTTSIVEAKPVLLFTFILSAIRCEFYEFFVYSSSTRYRLKAYLLQSNLDFCGITDIGESAKCNSLHTSDDLWAPFMTTYD